MKYIRFKDGYIKRLSDGALIPGTTDNPDYVDFLASGEAAEEVNGTVFEEADLVEEAKQKRKQKIAVAIRDIDNRRIRLLSDHILGVSSKIKGVVKAPKSFLQDLEDEAVALRTELAGLEA